MENYAFYVIILALVVYRWFPITDNNLLLLVDSKTENVKTLSEIPGLLAAFKIETKLKTYWKEDYNSDEIKVCIISLHLSKY